jgi:tagatose-6-phosphate ketose/aldose isomerase
VSSEILTKTEGAGTLGALTRGEILQQPDVWPDTLERTRASLGRYEWWRADCECVFTGAGSSAYAGMAIEAALPRGKAVPTTDLLADPKPRLAAGSVLVSLARSGDSPESVAVVRRIERSFPKVRHLAITCNAEGQLARHPGAASVILDPRTNDRSLAMTSSFSNLALAGICLGRDREIGEALAGICARVKQNFARLEETARALAAGEITRVVILASAELMGWAREGALKILEMTAGRIPVMAETHLGLRHGPMSFLRGDTLVLSLLSADPLRRRYEEDLLEELQSKQLGRIVVIAAEEGARPEFTEVVPAMAGELPDELRTPFEIVFPQVLAYHMSLQAGLNPDNPSPGGVINRVVRGVRIYEG